MKVDTVTRYVFQGKEYKSISEIKETIHNKIGEEVIDKINRVCPPEKHANLIKLLEVICSPEVRKVLIECFNVEIDIEDEWEVGKYETINVLDYKY